MFWLYNYYPITKYFLKNGINTFLENLDNYDCEKCFYFAKQKQNTDLFCFELFIELDEV